MQSGSSQASGHPSVVYFDEEECLGIDAFANELELLVANGKQMGRVDQAQLLELLPKVAATILKTPDRALLKSMQKRCEPALSELLLSGVSVTVRQLICVCITRFLIHGDTLSIYGQVSTLQTLLGGKDPAQAAKVTSDGIRVCLIEVLAHMALHHGRYLASAAPESLSIASKGVSKGSPAVRVAALHLAAATVEGMNSADRAALPAQVDAWTMFIKASRERTCVETRVAAAQVVRAIARAGGAALWRDGGYYWEEALRVCGTNIIDPTQSVRDAFALALCDLAVAVNHDVMSIAIRDEKKEHKKQALERLKADGGVIARRGALQQPLVEAALHNKADVCASMSLAWSSYIGYVAASSQGNPNILVDLATQVVLICDGASRQLSVSQDLLNDSSLGSALAGGELPHIQACVLYLLRTVIIESLSESGQRMLLVKLAEIVQRPVCPVPTAVVALEGLSILMDVLGEISDEGAATAVEVAIMEQVTSASTPCRQMASQAAAALAAAQPMNAARLLHNLLEQVAAATQLLGGVKPGVVGNSTTDAYNALMGKTAPVLMATAHGAALAAAGILLVTSNLPLSVPSSLPRQAYTIAVRLIMHPHSEGIATKALEREAGYILLGALIRCWSSGALSVAATIPAQSTPSPTSAQPPAANGSSEASNGVVNGVAAAATSPEMPAGAASPDSLLAPVLACLALSLGNAARSDMDEELYTHPGGDAELAMEIWWRSVALQTLRTYLADMVLPGRVPDPAAEMTQISDLLSPVMGVMEAQACLQDPFKAKGGAGGLLAACSATFQLRLLEVMQLLDVTRLQPASQSALLKMASKPVKLAGVAAGGLGAAQGLPTAAAVAAAGYSNAVSSALHKTALRYCLAQEDALLGPWPMGRDTAEDELHDFAGERGAPHKQPWEQPLLASLFSGVDAGSSSSSSSPAPDLKGGRHGLLRGSGVSLSTDRERGALYPQPLGLAPALLSAQAAVLGRLLAVMSNAVQLHILDDLINTATAGKNKKPVGSSRDIASRRQAAATLVSVIALSGLLPLSRKSALARTNPDVADKVADKVLQLANALLDAGLTADTGIARAGAQLLAASACIGTDGWGAKVVHAVVQEVTRSVAEGRDPERRAALCLALGCIHRSKGGLALQAIVPASVGALLTAVKRPVGHTALWALHALSLCATSSGGAYMQHVRATLQLCQDLLVRQSDTGSVGYDSPGLRPACSRLANSMVGVLGPEFTLGSQNYRMSKSLTSDLVHVGILSMDDTQAVLAASAPPPDTNSSGGPAPEPCLAPRPISMEALACELQAVLFAQQAILFAPDAVQASKHVPMLQATLLSRRPALRKAAAATLFHLSERDPGLLLPAHIEGALFAALDNETNASIAAHLRGTLQTLLERGGSSHPTYWIPCLSEVIFTSGATGAGSGANTADSAGAPSKTGDDGDDEEDEEGATSAAPAPGKGSSPSKTPAGNGLSKVGAGAGGGATPGKPQGLQALLATVALRLRTRLFAADMLLCLVQLEASSRQGQDVSSSNGHVGTPKASGEHLVDHLQELVDIGFKLATGSVDALRPAGVWLLDAILHGFSTVEDPLLPGARLLEQYQAQFVSALRAALSPGAGPRLAVAGGILATTFLESGLAAGDAQVMSRLLDLLTGPLASWLTQGSAGVYAEWVGVHQRVAILRAHAHCATLHAQGGDELTASIVNKAHQPYRSLLANLWSALLQDHVIVSSQHALVTVNYTSALLAASDGSSPAGGDDESAVPAANGVSTGGAGQPVSNTASVMSHDMAAAVKDVYASACPVVLAAVTSHFPTPQEVLESKVEDQGQQGPRGSHGLSVSLWTRYTNLLDVSLMLVTEGTGKLAVAVQQYSSTTAAGTSHGVPDTVQLEKLVSRLAAYVQGLHKLLGAGYVSNDLASPAVLEDSLSAMSTLASSVLLPLATLTSSEQPLLQPSPFLATLTSALTDLVKEVAHGMLPEHLGPVSKVPGNVQGSLAAALLDVILTASSAIVPFTITHPPAPTPPAKETSKHSKGGAALAQKPSGEAAAPAAAGATYQPASVHVQPASQATLDNCLVSLLVAATLLVRKSPAGSLSSVVPPLVQATIRLLSTCRPGVQLQATQRFLTTLITTSLTTTSADASRRLPDGACLAVAQLAQQSRDQLTVVQGSGAETVPPTGPDASTASRDQALSEPGMARLAARLAALPAVTGHVSSAGVGASDTQLPGVVTKLVLSVLSGVLAPSNGVAIKATSQVHYWKAVAAWADAQRAVFEGMRQVLQDAAAAHWAGSLLQTLGPHTAAATNQLLTDPRAAYGPPPAPGSNDEVDFAAADAAGAAEQAAWGHVSGAACEGIKAMLSAASFALTQGTQQSEAVLWVVVALLVEAASPPAGVTDILGTAPRDLALKLIASLSTSALGAPFKSVVSGLPPTSKSRLQAALQASASLAARPAAGAPAAGGAEAAAAKPTITLKTTFMAPSS